jgi:hypothetical protein
MKGNMKNIVHRNPPPPPPAKCRCAHYEQEALRANKQLGELHEKYMELSKQYDALWEKVNRPSNTSYFDTAQSQYP